MSVLCGLRVLCVKFFVVQWSSTQLLLLLLFAQVKKNYFYHCTSAIAVLIRYTIWMNQIITGGFVCKLVFFFVLLYSDVIIDSFSFYSIAIVVRYFHCLWSCFTCLSYLLAYWFYYCSFQIIYVIPIRKIQVPKKKRRTPARNRT